MLKVIAGVIRVIYRICALFPQQNKIVFLSRQAARPFDFTLLEPALAKALPTYRLVWCCVSSIGKSGPVLALKQIWHSATARVCLVDGYIPAISIPKAHRACVIQVWHAPGAIKKFGYQALDTPAGRSSKQARDLRMHCGYDYIVAGLPGAIPAFAEGFNANHETFLPFGLPRMDYLLLAEFEPLRTQHQTQAQTAIERSCATWNGATRSQSTADDGTSNTANQAAGANSTAASQLADTGISAQPATACSSTSQPTTILYAPTFRKGSADVNWLEHALNALCHALEKTDGTYRIILSGHPLETKTALGSTTIPVATPTGVSTLDLLYAADYVITDYSTVALEAGLVNKQVLFYVPDIEEYRASPGLNIDPLRSLPGISFTNAEALARVLSGASPYNNQEFSAFMAEQIGALKPGAIQRLVSFIQTKL